MTRALRSTFASIVASPNYRRYYAGQAVSMAGTWMQTVAQGWLVLQLTGSGTAVGLVVALQFLPVLLFGPLGGVLVDRFDTRRLLVGTHAVAGLLVLTLGVATVTDVVELWMVYTLAAGLGLVTAVDNPARQTFVLELVGPGLLGNAITLNSVNMNAARVVGPAIAAVLIATVGIGPCFMVNALSYLVVIGALMRLDRSALVPKHLSARAKGQVREGLRYVWSTPALRTQLIMMAIIGTLTYEFQVVLPLFARFTFDGDATTYGLLTGAMGVGAVMGGLATAARNRPGLESVARTGVAFGALVAVAALSPSLPLAIVALVGVGAASVAFLARTNTTMQLSAEPALRGRVMALWTVAFLGTTPIGGPLMGFVAQELGARFALGLSAAAAVSASLYAWSMSRAATTRSPAAPIAEGAPPGATALAAPGSR